MNRVILLLAALAIPSALGAQDCLPPYEPPPPHSSSSGDFAIDAYVARELAWLAAAADIPVTLRWARDDWGPRAYPADAQTLRGGIVYVDGGTAFRLADMGTGGRAALLGVLAHEFGHLLQMRRKDGMLTSGKHCELHADFIAGRLLAEHSDLNRLTVERAYLQAVEGDTDTTTHGRISQRLAAFTAGRHSTGHELPPALSHGQEVVLELLDEGDNRSGRDSILPGRDDSAARAQLALLEESDRVFPEPGGAVLQSQRRYRNDGADTVAVRHVLRIDVIRPGGESELLSIRTAQRAIAPGQEGVILLRSRAYAHPQWPSFQWSTETYFARIATLPPHP